MVLNYDNRSATVANTHDVALEHRYLLVIHSGCWLVQQEEGWTTRQGPGNFQPALQAVRELPGEVIPSIS